MREMEAEILRILNPARSGSRGFTCKEITEKILYSESRSVIEEKVREAKRRAVQRALTKGMPSLFVYSVKPNYCNQDCDELRENQTRYWYRNSETTPFEEEEKILALAVLHKFSMDLLPPNLHASISVWLGCQTRNHKWIDRVDSKSRYPEISLVNESTPATRQVLLEAMMRRHGFRANYMDIKDEVFYPVRLVQRERVTYLVCCRDELSVGRELALKPYALHRFTNVRFVEYGSKFIADRAFDLASSEIEKLVRTPTKNEAPIEEGTVLKEFDIRIFGMPAQHLSEVSFHDKDEKHCTKAEIISRDQHGRVIEVVLQSKNVCYTYELKCWILGLGGYARVEKPDNLKSLIKEEIEKMHLQYQDP